MSATANKKQLNRRTQGNLGLLEAGRLTDEESKLKDSLSLSKPMWRETGYRVGLQHFHAKIPVFIFICCNESFPGN